MLLLWSSVATAQNYDWSLALRGVFHAVAFNPLSNGKIIFAGSRSDGVFRSDDGGQTWVNRSGGQSMSDIHQVLCIPSDTGVVLAVTSSQFFRSTDGGLTWADYSDSLFGDNGEVLSYHQADDIIYYGDYGYEENGYNNPVWMSKDRGATWSLAGHNTTSFPLFTSAVSVDTPPIILAGNDTGLLERSTDLGETFGDPISDSGEDFSAEVPKIVFSDYATSTDGSHSVAIASRWLAYTPLKSLVATPDGGKTWQTVHIGNAWSWAVDIDQRASMVGNINGSSYTFPLHFWDGLFAQRGDTVHYGLTQGSGIVLETTDGGETWHGTNFPVFRGTMDTLITQIWVLKYDTTSGKLAVATERGIYVTNTRAGVAQSPNEQPSIDIVLHGSLLNINGQSRSIGTVAIFDILGRPVFQTISRSFDYQMSTFSFTPGVYLIKVDPPDGIPAFKLVTLP